MTLGSWRMAGVALLGMSLLLSACGSDVGGSSASLKAPNDETFYVAPDDLSSFSPGELIWSRDYDGPHAIEGASNSLILYTQKAHNGPELVGVSGIVTVPSGEPPAGGWPVISWGHGSTGLADRCAPTYDTAVPENNFVNEQFIAEWVDKGYAVVRSDFEGLGTPGDHPYLIGPSAGRSVLNIVTAAQELDPDLSDDVVLAGHSQGGHAALWGASMTDSVRGLNIKAVVSFAPPTHLAGALEAVISGMAKAPSGIIAIVTRGLEIGHPEAIDTDEFLLPAGKEPYSRIDNACFGEIFGPEYFGNVPVEEFGDAEADLTVAIGKLNANDPSFRNISIPILLAQGDKDTTVPSIMTNFLAEEYEANGLDVIYKKYPRADHNSVLAEAKDVANEFIDTAFASK